MSSDCESYYTEENVLVENFTCPKADGDTTALYCCGFSDLKYCCADPNSFFPYEYGYMWWLSLGALMGLSIAAVVLLAFIITLCVLCYLFITTKPRGLDNGLPLRTSDEHIHKHKSYYYTTNERCFALDHFLIWKQNILLYFLITEALNCRMHQPQSVGGCYS
uniref:Shisa like 2A n=1 Tax=Oreochromis niloticus TaxID=8128 RepID=A0A669DND5_ORENI